MCHAFRRWNDIGMCYRFSQCSSAMLTRRCVSGVHVDLARNIYRNATLEKITFLRSAAERERETAKQTEKWAVVSTVRCGLRCCFLVC